MLLIFLTVACASGKPLPIHEEKGDVNSAVFHQGLEEIKAGNYYKARRTLDDFLTKHPMSPVRTYVEVYIKLLDDISSLKHVTERDQRELERLERELREAREHLVTLKQEMKRDQEKYQREIEDLKRDLDYLKELEIELKRRGRLTR